MTENLTQIIPEFVKPSCTGNVKVNITYIYCFHDLIHDELSQFSFLCKYMFLVFNAHSYSCIEYFLPPQWRKDWYWTYINLNLNNLNNPYLHNYESKSLFYILIAIVTILNNKRFTCNQIADPTCILWCFSISIMIVTCPNGLMRAWGNWFNHSRTWYLFLDWIIKFIRYELIDRAQN